LEIALILSLLLLILLFNRSPSDPVTDDLLLCRAASRHVYSRLDEVDPIKGTSMQYATNTVDTIVELESTYYLCLQGVWFMAPTPTGPWSTCMSVPNEIYTIPSSSPIYNVAYVTQSTNPDGTVTAAAMTDLAAAEDSSYVMAETLAGAADPEADDEN
jgi:sucrose-6-phosphate hydrolase SacC (GH32 family)